MLNVLKGFRNRSALAAMLKVWPEMTKKRKN